MSQANSNKKKIVINLDDIKEVSPVKINHANNQGVFINKNRRSSVGRIQQFPAFNLTFSKQEQMHLNGVAVELRGIQLFRLTIIKCFQQLQKNGYFKKTSGKTEYFFKEMRSTFLKTLETMKQERLKTINIQDIQMSRPNQDIFQLFKSKYLNLMLLEQQQIFKMQQSFKDGSYKSKPEGKLIKEKKQQIQRFIFEQCSSITKQQFERIFTPIIQRHNENELRSYNQEKNECMRATQKMMELKARMDNLQQRKKINQCNQVQKKLKLKFGDSQINFFRLNSLFL